ncbi:MAG: VOC family protein, partial [Thermoanaerobaculia bacterium]
VRACGEDEHQDGCHGDEQFNLPFMKQDELGVWTPPNGDRVAWFKDPDGNVLSISQHNPENLKR